MGRFILIDMPTVCVQCGKLIRAGRVAFWQAGQFSCYSCIRKGRGEAPESAEEKHFTRALVDEIDGTKN